MIRINDAIDGAAIGKAAGYVYNIACDMCIARVENDELYGGVVYSSYTRASINIHMAGFRDNWCNMDMLWVAFDYPFNQLGVTKIFGQVPLSNKLALKIDLKLGFKKEMIAKDVFPIIDGTGDMQVFSMYKADCKWLKIRPKHLVSNISEKEDLDGR